MKEQILQPAPLSRTLQGKARESNTASVSNVLQAYKNGISQRQEVDEDELLQGKFETAQRDELEDEELLQGKFETTQRKEAPNNTGLPDNLKAGVEQLSGLDMSDVKVHYNSSKPASIQAYAYTQGTDIHVAPGQEKYLGHEAWHVAQQKQGRVQPTTNVGGMPVNDNAGLEKEADVMGGKAVQMKPEVNKSGVHANSVVQEKSGVKQGFGFVDNRTEVVSQRILKETMNNGLRILQRQQFGEQKVNYITNGQAPIAGTLDFNSVNTKNEKYGTRAEAFKRAKDLAGASTADRTFDYHANPAGNEEGKRVQIVPAANPQRDGRYYDFLNGNLIAEHTSDNQAIITIGGMPQNTVPHFHVASYQGDRYMDLGNLGGDGIRRNQNVPPQYNILYGGHHIYY